MTLLGHGMGGWIAAEMAVMAPSAVNRLILISAVGVRPRKGEITDIFLHGLTDRGVFPSSIPSKSPTSNYSSAANPRRKIAKRN
jgi:pimeloyl-ACP methyl ester carboxylesterase